MPLQPDGRFTPADAGPDDRAEADALATSELPALDALLAMDPDVRRGVRGVRLGPADALADLLPELDHLSVVAIDFPTFTDGRGFSHARRLRATRGWTGELRAVGDVRLDQARSMLRCGFDALEFREVPDAAVLARALDRFGAGYQPSYAAPRG